MIHKAKSLHHDKEATEKEKRKWHRDNHKLYRKRNLVYYSDPNSCSFNYAHDVDCKTGILSKFTGLHQCKACCNKQLCQTCTKCKGTIIENYMVNPCCVESIFNSNNYCNQTLPSCIMTQKSSCN